MTSFIVFAALITLLTLGFLLLPLLRKATTARQEMQRKETNLVIFRTQLDELADEKASGALGEAEYQQAKAEIQRRLVEDVPEEQVVSSGTRQGERKLALALVMSLPLLAAAGYWYLGNPRALDPLAVAQPATMTPEKIQKMVEGLAEHLKAEPDDMQGWLMLARSYRNMGRNAEAVAAFQNAELLVMADPDLLTEYADLLAMQAGGRLVGKPLALINKALHLDPDHVLALWLAGTAAYDNLDFAAALVFWERGVKNLPPESEDARMLQDSIQEAKRRLNLRKDTSKAVIGRIELSPALKDQVSPDDTVFIFARPVDGSRIPLAALKVRVSDLPYAFTLDDSLAMMPDKLISTEKSVLIQGRVSKTGDAIAKPGDLQSDSLMVKPGEKKARIVIDRAYSKP